MTALKQCHPHKSFREKESKCARAKEFNFFKPCVFELHLKRNSRFWCLYEILDIQLCVTYGMRSVLDDEAEIIFVCVIVRNDAALGNDDLLSAWHHPWMPDWDHQWWWWWWDQLITFQYTSQDNGDVLSCISQAWFVWMEIKAHVFSGPCTLSGFHTQYRFVICNDLLIVILKMCLVFMFQYLLYAHNTPFDRPVLPLFHSCSSTCNWDVFVFVCSLETFTWSFTGTSKVGVSQSKPAV